MNAGPKTEKGDTMSNTEQNIKTIKTVLEPARAALEAMCLKQLRAQSDRIAARLNECGGDFKAAYPYGHSREMHARREIARSLTVQAPGAPCVSLPSDPEPRTMRPDLAAHQEAEARTFADSFIVSYAGKLAAKIAEADAGFVIQDASYSGSADPFSNSQLVLYGTGARMVWNTRCIINVSKYGKLFNQWPTRKAA